ncbi:DHA2 family methylenomycin A resistance protein-like MFS transporter [Kribbella amoyensis]|uniref:DHA2 family methylenomycin A resistance protein-like MFS transporter n=1 Tax=Kribbella amoyensis TaxID=996641 RepID=A0A561BXE0_9ACTN|nr:MFS transporter [Kribbella amoyensis]TWD83511.1 DHA2 family methylenomycin A resistance protein-like MFS transporter [Kribbella amoyensis]
MPSRIPALSAVTALPAACLSFFLITLNASMVTTALPTIGRDVGGGPRLAWVLTGYSLVFALALLPAGSWSDRIGARRAFLLGTSVFATTSAACALADDLAFLLAARAIQGLAAAAILPSGLALLNTALPDPVRRAKAIGHWAAAGAVALVVGSPVGGAITTTLGWQGTFWLTVPLALLALAFALPLSPVRRAPAARGSTRSHRPTLVVSTVTGFAVNFSSYGAIFVVTLFLQNELGRSAWITGLVFVPMTLLIIPANLLAGSFGTRRILVVGQTLMAVGLVGLCTVGHEVALWVVITWLLPIGIGAGLVAPAMTTVMLTGVPAERSGFGAGLLNASRQVGSGISAALFGVLLGAGSFLTGFRVSLVLATIAVVVSTILAVRVPVRSTQPAAGSERVDACQ